MSVTAIKTTTPIRTDQVPSDDMLLGIVTSHYQEFQMPRKAAEKTRRRLYALNKNNVRWSFRTMYDGAILRVFKFEK